MRLKTNAKRSPGLRQRVALRRSYRRTGAGGRRTRRRRWCDDVRGGGGGGSGEASLLVMGKGKKGTQRHGKDEETKNEKGEEEGGARGGDSVVASIQICGGVLEVAVAVEGLECWTETHGRGKADVRRN